MTRADDHPPRDHKREPCASPPTLEEENARLRAENEELKKTIILLLAQIEDLERRLKLNRSDSGKPPSSDGLKKQKRERRTSSLRDPSAKPSGGQKGHKGNTLQQTDTPAHTVEHDPETCSGCGSALSAAMSTGFSARQVVDLPAPQPLTVTGHRAHRCHCASCGKPTRAECPENVTAPVQYSGSWPW